MDKGKKSGHHENVHPNKFKQPNYSTPTSVYLKSLKVSDVPISVNPMSPKETGMSGPSPKELSDGYVCIAKPEKPSSLPAGVKMRIKAWSPKGRK